jgi:hypothetical protein
MRFPLALLSALLSFSANSAFQTPKRNPSSTKRVLSLDQVLGCKNDEWFTAAWTATKAEMIRQDYGAVGLRSLRTNQPETNSFPFVTAPLRSDPRAFSLLPPNGSTKTGENNFCHSATVANYLNDDYNSKPTMIEVYVEADHWTFDFSQLLRHADQFEWKSGVFSDSSDTYLSAVKGNCTLQFLVSTGVPRLYRVMYGQ